MNVESGSQWPAFSDGAWNLADIWESHASRFPSAPVLVCDDRRITWAEMDQRADGIAELFLTSGLQHQDKVAHYLYNCPEYIESMFAMFKAGLVPVNTNYRYTDDELAYLWDNADVVAVVFHGSFAPTIERIRHTLSNISVWIWVDDGSGLMPDWAVPYEGAATSRPGRQAGPWGRSGDDLYLLYTGGTTGQPKGVMWRQDDVVMSLEAPAKTPLPSVASVEALVDRVRKPGIVMIPAAPLMHGTGAFAAIGALILGGTIVTLSGRKFDPMALLDCIDRERVTSMSIVGDAFARPLVRTLDEHPGRWDFSSMRVITSSGVMWSAETKQALLRHNARLIMVDALGSSEALGMARSTTTSESDASETTASFKPAPGTRVLNDAGDDVVPGSGEMGRVALRGRTPLGYYKDAAKSATTFVLVDGVRYSIPGDWATLEADGTLKLLGRGSQCINTGGEKVYPEEVEEALKAFPGVLDAVVVGIPDDRFGSAVVGVIEEDGTVNDDALTAHVRLHLAAYKAPKRLLRVPSIERAANGKVDYRRLQQLAADTVEAG